MGRHLLIYDVEWWILGKHAKVIQQYHPSLDLMSIGELIGIWNGTAVRI